MNANLRTFTQLIYQVGAFVLLLPVLATGYHLLTQGISDGYYGKSFELFTLAYGTFFPILLPVGAGIGIGFALLVGLVQILKPHWLCPGSPRIFVGAFLGLIVAGLSLHFVASVGNELLNRLFLMAAPLIGAVIMVPELYAPCAACADAKSAEKA